MPSSILTSVPNTGRLTLILGGVRSGKSACAEQLAHLSGLPVAFVATAQPLDEEMEARILAHRAARPASWRTIEAPNSVGLALLAATEDGQAAILDCLTLLVSNCLVALAGAGSLDDVSTAALQSSVATEVEKILDVAMQRRLQLFVVSNEVGMGVMPASASARHFGDVLGWANQRFARAANEVLLMIAGIPVEIRRLERATR